MTWDQDVDGFGTCGSCKQPRTYYYWCSSCEYKRYQSTHPNWTSGNPVIDNLIHDIQREAPSIFSFLEWIPSDRFSNTELIGKGAFSTVYSATWIEGPQDGPPVVPNFSASSNKNLPTWERQRGLKVALKFLRNSSDIGSEFFSELRMLCRSAPDSEDFDSFSLRHILRCYGITQDSKTGDYAMVMQYAEHGDLHSALARNPTTDDLYPGSIRSLKHIAIGLSIIHAAGLIHRDLHSGNVLRDGKSTFIADAGLSKLTEPQKILKKGVYGVMPYIAPEVLLGGAYSQAADVYSFGILIWEFLHYQRPFSDRAHDPHLHLAIYNGLRPQIGEHVPEHLRDLMQQCWGPDPLKRPTADQLESLLSVRTKMGSEGNIKIPRQQLLVEADPKDPSVDESVSKTHPEAIYTTRFHRFIDPINSTSFGASTRHNNDETKNLIAHKVKEIKRAQKEVKDWKEQDFRILVDWYYWTNR